MPKLKVYYAHPVSLYNTPQERRDLATLETLGFIVYNPNCQDCADGYKKEGMDFFWRKVTSCDALAFRSFPDGSVPAGVAKEIVFAKDADKPILELPSGILKRELEVDETKEYLSQLGQR